MPLINKISYGIAYFQNCAMIGASVVNPSANLSVNLSANLSVNLSANLSVNIIANHIADIEF
jgi:hypothetical protein